MNLGREGPDEDAGRLPLLDLECDDGPRDRRAPPARPAPALRLIEPAPLEGELREMELREDELREDELREDELREDALREDELREDEPRELELRELELCPLGGIITPFRNVLPPLLRMGNSRL